MTATAPDQQLCLIAEARAGAEWLARVESALGATRAATLILTGIGDDAIDAAAARALVSAAQAKNVAALLADDIASARALGADGVHLSWRPEIEDAAVAARKALGENAIVGADAGTSRHDAMTLGEAGIDYIAFSATTDGLSAEEALDLQKDLVAWWSDVFLVPVVAYGIETSDDVARLAESGADFIAVRLPSAASESAASHDTAWGERMLAALAPGVGAA